MNRGDARRTGVQVEAWLPLAMLDRAIGEFDFRSVANRPVAASRTIARLEDGAREARLAKLVGGDHAVGVDARAQALTEHRQHVACQLHADLLLLIRRERVDDTTDGAGGPVGVQRTEHQVPGFGGRDGGRGRRDDRRNNNEDGGEELIEKLVHINRVSKTVKGGKRFGFAALVVVGDGKGRVGFGHGKAREVPEAISKATASAKKKMIRVPLREGRTLHHDGNGHFGAGKVTLRSAPQGTGIIAGGPMRAVFESLGVADVVTKSVGTSNPYNMIRATFEALGDQTSPKSVAQRRGKKIADLLGRGGSQTAEADAAAIAE